MIWAEKRVILIVVGLLLIANLVFFFTYRVQYEQRVEGLRDRLEVSEGQLAAARTKRQDLESQLKAHDDLVSTIDSVYDEWWSTPDERLTKVIVEVKDLGAKSGLVPDSINFSKDSEVDRMNTTTMGFSFNVEGTYEQTRQLINLIELSDQFLIIDSVTLSNAQEDRLTLTLHLKTLFRGEEQPRLTGAGS